MASEVVLIRTCDVICGIAAIIGCILMWRSVRMIDYSRYYACEACGYDLKGTKVDSKCPECGHSASADSSRKGQKVKLDVSRMAKGITCLLLSAMLIVFVHAPIVSIYPNILLMLLAKVSPRGAVHTCLGELSGRVGKNELPLLYVDSLVSDALKSQSTYNAEWDPAWGEFVERAAAASAISDDQTMTYLSQAFQSRLVIKEFPDGGVRYSLVIDRIRTCRSSRVCVDFEDLALRLGFYMQIPCTGQYFSTGTGIIESITQPIAFDYEVPANIKELYEATRTVQLLGTEVRLLSQHQLTRPLRLEHLRSLDESSSPSIELINKQSILNSVSVMHDPKNDFGIVISLKDPPMNLSFDVDLIESSSRTPIGQIARRPGMDDPLLTTSMVIDIGKYIDLNQASEVFVDLTPELFGDLDHPPNRIIWGSPLRIPVSIKANGIIIRKTKLSDSANHH